MKTIDMSQAPTSICLTMDEPSSSAASSSILLSRSPAIDRHNPIIRDSRRSSSIPIPRTTKPPHNKKKGSSNNNRIPTEENTYQAKKKPDEINVKISKNSWTRTKAAEEFISPPGSTRYLLSEQVFFKDLSGFGNTLIPSEDSRPEAVKTNVSEESVPPSPNEVVVLRVSLHCRGCERKMRKHISRMKGVTSFDIDFVAKKVTVVGNVTPLEVLSSISKVKNAQLWPPTLSISPAFNPDSHIKNLDQ